LADRPDFTWRILCAAAKIADVRQSHARMAVLIAVWRLDLVWTGTWKRFSPHSSRAGFCRMSLKLRRGSGTRAAYRDLW